jgi:hypothetical protein
MNSHSTDDRQNEPEKQFVNDFNYLNWLFWCYGSAFLGRPYEIILGWLAQDHVDSVI